MIRALAIIVALAAFASSAAPSKRPDPRKRERQFSAVNVPAFTQASIGCTGLPDGLSFPGYLGRCIASVNAAGTAEVTQCYDATGAEVTTTQGTGASYECAWTPPGGGDCVRAQKDVSDTSAAFVPAASAQAWLGAGFWAADHTVYVVAHPTTLSSANPVLLSNGLNNADGFYMQLASPSATCVYNAAATQQSAASGGGTGASRWAVWSCSRSGTNYVTGINGTSATTAITVSAVNPSSRNLYLGRFDGAGVASRGPLAAVYFFSAAHSSADKTRFESQVTCAYGSTPSGQVAITDTVAGARFEVGAVERENLIVQSEAFATTPWTNTVSGATVNVANNTTDVTDPNGGNTASKLVFSAVNGSNYAVQRQVFSGSGAFSASVYLRTLSGTATVYLGDPNAPATACAVTSSWTRCLHENKTTAAFVDIGTNKLGAGQADQPAQTIYAWGAQRNTGATATTYARTFADARPAGPFVFAHGDNARWATSSGLASYGGPYTNAATNSTAMASQSAIGTPVITSDSTSGPFDRYMGVAASADTVNDDDAAGNEGVMTASAGTAATTYTMTAFVKAGTLAAARLATNIGGGAGGGTCTYSGLSTLSTATCTPTTGTCSIVCSTGLCSTGAAAFANGFARLVCTPGAVTGTPTSVQAILYNGSAGADTGTLFVNEIEIGVSSVAMPPCPAGAAAATCGADVHTVSTSGWPTTSGEVVVKYTADQSAAPSANAHLIDSRNSGTEFNGVDIYRDTGNRAGVVIYDATGLVCNIGSAPLTWTAAKNLKARWTPTTCELFADGVSVASGAMTRPLTAHNATGKIGGYVGGTANNANGSVKLTCVSNVGGCP